MSNVLAFNVADSRFIGRADMARAECLRLHRIRFALADIAWRVSHAPITLQDATKIGTLERLAKLTIVPIAKPVKMTMRGCHL